MNTMEMNTAPNNSVQAEGLPLWFVGKALALALVLLVGMNVLVFLFFYRDTLTPWPLPYREDFETTTRLDYRQFGGKWRLQDHQLLQSQTQEPDLLAVIPLHLEPDQAYRFGTQLKVLQGPKGGGILFNLQQPNSRQQSHLVRFGSSDGKDYLVFGYFDENLEFIAQGSIPPPDVAEGAELSVQVHDQTYDVLVNGQPQQRDIPLQFRGGQVGLTTWFSSVAFDNIYIEPLDVVATAPNNSAATATNAPAATTTPVAAQPAAVVATPVVSTQSVITQQTTISATANQFFTEQFSDSADQTLWTPLTGDWRFEEGALIQYDPSGYDYSISRAGVFTRFALSVHLRHRQGVGGGLLFNMPNDNTKRQGHLVRYFEDNTLVWGYFDDENAFQGQGYAVVAPPADQLHTLQVIVGDTTYAIFLDNQRVAENIPLISTQGHLGLTVSKSIVAFEEVIITEIQ